MMPEIVTIGVYGFDEEAFFHILRAAGVDTFCDVRQRRGMRGARYAFANSARLQTRLEDMGIRYLHIKKLAPSQATRSLQRQDDESQGVTKRERTVLSPEFVRAYEAEYLSYFDSDSFLTRLGPDARVVALFCVEREPAACHRSLVAQWLARDWGVTITHLRP